MNNAPGLLLTILAFLAVIGPLVFVHEMGHYLVGRWFGVKAEVFSIGFGREIFGFTDRLGTRWKFGWLPLGGYVRFAGDMNPASQPDPAWMLLPAEERNRTFQSKSVGRRALIVAAGPLTNFLFAILIIAGFVLVQGQPSTAPIAGKIMAGSPAEQAGFASGDVVKRVDGQAIASFAALTSYVRSRPDTPITADVARGGEEIAIRVTPRAVPAVDQQGQPVKMGMLGISGQTEPVGPLTALRLGAQQSWYIVRIMADGLGEILTGSRSAQELGGPLRIAQASGQMAADGLGPFAFFIALISINLGFINLLPVPMLDGGHLLFYALEAVRRKPVAPQVQEWAFRSGLLLLLGLMLFATFNDLSAFGLWRGLSGLIG
ncbi:RIP metalloprotease RseP [Sphingomonas sp. MAH-20]|uniref:Zinc metalloprotease n=1 Tax=Sphingomonas horti TaxID=2682842 RepID=A0A6I4J0X8_9SPHN|nr:MULTISPECIES: RIP metalloprotease RseP [Sphingomonas]MBA2919339.1 RIP metalloprotease RseP [Sphingomonas sp. CGMCC 1.13658]MVO78220.1 RIP metalloprotease RseP [Sphingomonas horti]